MKVFLLSAAVLLSPCGYAATLSKEQAIALANTFAKREGFDPAQFSAIAYYEPQYKRNEWFICYKALASSQTKASSFYVILNDTATTASALLAAKPCE